MARTYHNSDDDGRDHSLLEVQPSDNGGHLYFYATPTVALSRKQVVDLRDQLTRWLNGGECASDPPMIEGDDLA